MPPRPRNAQSGNEPQDDKDQDVLRATRAQVRAPFLRRTSGRSSPSGPGADAPAGPENGSTDDRDDPRRVAHEILGQAHAVVVRAYDPIVLDEWSLQDLRAEGIGAGLDAVEALRRDDGDQGRRAPAEPPSRTGAVQ